MSSPTEDPGLSSPSGGPATYFAPAGRDSAADLRQSARLLRATSLLQATMDAIPAVVVILNRRRQIVAANRAMLEMLAVGPDDVLGKRPGEVIECAHCHDGPDGCGTGRYCSTCGAVLAVLGSQQSGGQITKECRLTLSTPEGETALDLRVTATAVQLGQQSFTICTLEDISDRKRLAVLSRMFFHDVLNTAVGMQYCMAAASKRLPAREDDFLRLGELLGQLIEEIKAQRDLTLAESGDLEVVPEPVRIAELVQQLQSLYATRAVATHRTIRWEEVWDGQVETDPRLLARVLGNMLTNALEATEPGGTVTAACAEQGDRVRFRVHNDAVMPEHVRLQVFQRSFSTKQETGRGIGTHSMKLFGERYLGGKVAFTSRAPEGTTFTITLPKVFPRGEGSAPS